MLDAALERALFNRPPIWATGAGDWWDFTGPGRAKRGVGAQPAETRASDGWAENEAGLLVKRSANTRSMAGKGLLTYPTRQNKCTNYNAALAALVTPSAAAAFNAAVTNMTATGDAAALYGVVDDSAALATAGLGNIVGNGRVIKIDNSAGAGIASVIFGGTTGNTNTHIGSAFVRGGTGSINDNVGAGSVGIASSAAYVRRATSAFTPGATTRTLAVSAAAGQILYVILNQFEEGSFATPPIVVAGASATANGPQQVIDIGSRAAGGIGLIIDVDVREVGSTLSRLFELNDGTGNNLFHAYMIQGSQTLVWQAIVGGALQAVSNCAIPASGRMVVSAACSAGFMKVRCVGQAEAAAETPPAHPALATKLAPLGRAYDAARNSYGYAKRLALWYGPMSAHFFDNVLWPKAQLLAQVA